MKDQSENSENNGRLEREVQFDLDQIRQALEGLRYGQVTIVIHDGGSNRPHREAPVSKQFEC